VDKNHLNDSVFDALFRQAVIDNFHEEYNSLPQPEELSCEHTFSNRHEKRMKALFVRMERKERLDKIIYLGRKVAAIFLIFVTLVAGALMLNPDVRATVTETIISWQREFVRFFSPTAEIEGYSMVPIYIPIGFSQEFYEVINNSTLILYMDENGETILFEAHRAAGALYIDNENTVYEVLSITGNTYHILSSLVDYENSIIWEIGGWRYFLRSSIGVEALKEMALSLGENS